MSPEVKSLEGKYNFCFLSSLPESDTEHANSLIELDIPSEGLNNKSLSSCTLPQGSKIMPDILNFPPPKPGTFSASCPTVNDHHKEKR